MSYTQSNNIEEYRDICSNRTKSNLLMRTGTAIAISTIMSLSYSGNCTEDLIPINETHTFQFIGNKEFKLKVSYKDRYAQISKSDWFVNSYKNMSIGELLNLD